MVMAANVVVCEVLCVLINKLRKVPVKNLKEVMINFYELDESVAAKELLHDELTKLNLEGLSRLTWRQGDNRKQRELDDLVQYATRADEVGLLSSLPTFVAANLDRVPSIKPEEMDLCLLMCKLFALESSVRKHDELLNRASAAPEHMTHRVTDTDSDSTVHTDGQSTRQSTADTVPAPAETWVDVATAGELNWTVVQKKKPPQSPRPRRPVRVRGSKEVDQSSSGTPSSVRSVPRKAVLAAYVGRLHTDTTEDALTNFLLKEGTKGVVCRKLKPKDGKVYKTSAFYVTCCTDSASLFYDKNSWPDGIELRDWIYK